MNENYLRKVQAATIIANSLDYTPSEEQTPEEIISMALAVKPDLSEDQAETLERMLKLAESIGIIVEEKEDDDMDEDELDEIAAGVTDWHHVIDAYDDEELHIVDDETGEVLHHDINEELLLEVLSRVERIRAKMRFARSETKREIKAKLALKRRSNTATLTKRARRLAVSMMKQKLTKKTAANMTISDKERAEAIIARRKALINRLAMKLMPRIKKIEKDRLTHKSTL